MKVLNKILFSIIIIIASISCNKEDNNDLQQDNKRIYSIQANYPNGDDYNETFYEYDKNGRIVKRRNIRKSDNIDYITTDVFKYDTPFKIIVEHMEKSTILSKPANIYEYELNDKKLITHCTIDGKKIISCHYDDNNKIFQMCIGEFEYSEYDGSLVQNCDFLIRYEWDHNLLIKKYFTDFSSHQGSDLYLYTYNYTTYKDKSEGLIQSFGLDEVLFHQGYFGKKPKNLIDTEDYDYYDSYGLTLPPYSDLHKSYKYEYNFDENKYIINYYGSYHADLWDNNINTYSITYE